MLFTI